MLNELSQFIQGNPDPRELKRALAVQMVLQDYRHREIQALMQVSSGFISKWTQAFEQHVEGLRLQHKGSTGYLDTQERLAVLEWLKQKNYWDLQELQAYLENSYDVVLRSLQSYYELFEIAGISWKKTQKRNPKKEPKLVGKKPEITTWLEAHRVLIESGELVVLFLDEGCDLYLIEVSDSVYAF